MTDTTKERAQTLEGIRGAVARGWCHEPNCSKELDGDLAEAISQEIVKLLARAEQSTETPPISITDPEFQQSIGKLSMAMGNPCLEFEAGKMELAVINFATKRLAESPRPVQDSQSVPTYNVGGKKLRMDGSEAPRPVGKLGRCDTKSSTHAKTDHCVNWRSY